MTTYLQELQVPHTHYLMNKKFRTADIWLFCV